MTYSEMHNPPHPGEVLKGLYLQPANITQTRLAEWVKVDRKTISRLVNGRHGVTAEMDLRLSKALNMSPGVWLGMQLDYDLWHAQKSQKVALRNIKPMLSDDSAQPLT